MTSEHGFDAARHVIKLKGKEYLEVKFRLLWLRTEQPDAVIETEMVSHIANPPMAIFKARVSLAGGGSATGWGQEEAADFGDYLEKAETKALGRALAALGFGTTFTEEFSESGPDGQRVVDAPVERRAASYATAGGNGTTFTRDEWLAKKAAENGGEAPVAPARPAAVGDPLTRPALPATEPQIKAIYAIGHGAHSLGDEEIEAECLKLFDKMPAELSRREASEFIDMLKAGIKAN